LALPPSTPSQSSTATPASKPGVSSESRVSSRRVHGSVGLSVTAGAKRFPGSDGGKLGAVHTADGARAIAAADSEVWQIAAAMLAAAPKDPRAVRKSLREERRIPRANEVLGIPDKEHSPEPPVDKKKKRGSESAGISRKRGTITAKLRMSLADRMKAQVKDPGSPKASSRKTVLEDSLPEEERRETERKVHEVSRRISDGSKKILGVMSYNENYVTLGLRLEFQIPSVQNMLEFEIRAADLEDLIAFCVKGQRKIRAPNPIHGPQAQQRWQFDIFTDKMSIVHNANGDPELAIPGWLPPREREKEEQLAQVKEGFGGLFRNNKEDMRSEGKKRFVVDEPLEGEPSGPMPNRRECLIRKICQQTQLYQMIVESLTTKFEEMDRNEDGNISMAEFELLVRGMDPTASADQVKRMYSQSIPSDGRGLDLIEFVKMMVRQYPNLKSMTNAQINKLLVVAS